MTISVKLQELIYLKWNNGNLANTMSSVLSRSINIHYLFENFLCNLFIDKFQGISSTFSIIRDIHAFNNIELTYVISKIWSNKNISFNNLKSNLYKKLKNKFQKLIHSILGRTMRLSNNCFRSYYEIMRRENRWTLSTRKGTTAGYFL